MKWEVAPFALTMASHYGDPFTSNCLPDETNTSVPGVTGMFCSPACQGAADLCPLDKPSGTTATPQCVLQGTKNGDTKKCALLCATNSSMEEGAQCGMGAVCQKWHAGYGICVFENRPLPPSPTPFAPANDYAQDRKALDLLFTTTQDFDRSLFWLDTNNWKNESASMCKRYGITCTEPDSTGKRRVMDISLGGNQLMNSLPTGFFSNLPQLRVFGCANNRLTGTIPADLPEARMLAEFEGYHNQFTGGINVFSALQNFDGRLDLHFNSFNGTLPSDFGKMNRLTYLSVANNQIQGTIPSTWKNLTELTILGLANNNLTGTVPSFIGTEMKKLFVLFLRNNSLTGAVPSLIGLQRLSVLDLDANNFTSLPRDLCSLPQHVFDKDNCDSDWGGSQECCLRDNPLNCLIPYPPCAARCKATCNCSNFDERCALSEIYASTNGSNWYNSSGWFDPDFPDPCTWHGISCDTIDGDAPYTRVIAAAKANAKKRVITGMDLAANNLVGRVPESLGNLSGLRTLRLSHNTLLDLPHSISRLHGLTALEIWNTSIPMAFPRLDNCTRLEVLDLKMNRITGTIPSSTFERLAAARTPLQVLSLANNSLTGTVPAALCSLPLEVDCTLVGNNFSTALPGTCASKCSV